MTEPVAGADQRALASMANQLAIQQREIELIKMGQNTASLGFGSIEAGSLVIYDADGNVRNVIGLQDDGSYVGGASPVALDPPEIPNPPLLSPGFGTIMVQSRGSTDPPWPRSFSHLNVYLSQGTGADGDPITEGVVVGTIIGTVNSAFVIAGLDPKPYRVWMTSVGIDTAESEPCAAQTVTPVLVVGQDILDGAIDELKLADDAVTAAKLAAASVGSIQIQGEVIQTAHLADGSVDGEKIIANAIAAGHLAAESVTAVALAADAVQANNIAADQIQARHLVAGSVTSEAILALSIQADHLGANAVVAGKIDAGAIRADHLQAGIIIADASFVTGSSGRRIMISGPGNEIRFFPQLNENAYGRVFSYVSDVYPDDVNVELRAIDSDEVNVQPRLIMTPDTVVGALTDRGDDTVFRGGFFSLEEAIAGFGLRTNTGFDTGIYFTPDAGIKMRGFFPNHLSTPDDAIFVTSYVFTNTSTVAANGYWTGIDIAFSQTKTRPYTLLCTIGCQNADQHLMTVRDDIATTTMDRAGSLFGLDTSIALEPQKSVGSRWLMLSLDVALTDSGPGPSVPT